MAEVKLVWVTPDAEKQIAYMARVSNPTNQNNEQSAPKLLKYLMDNKHWSPFEMVNICMEIQTTRDIARQILRHRSFSFQEFSQRYAIASDYEVAEARTQDLKNRQNSIEVQDEKLQKLWADKQKQLLDLAQQCYQEALDLGIAKEVARKVLPEGLTMSKMYMNGTLRSWIHYINIRCDMATQKEHRIVADKCREIIVSLFPSLNLG